MKIWTTIGLVAVRELVERVKSKAFIFSTAFIMLLVVAAIVVPALAGDEGPSEFDVTTAIPLSDAAIDQFTAASGGDPILTVTVVADDAAVRAAVEAGDARVLSEEYLVDMEQYG